MSNRALIIEDHVLFAEVMAEVLGNEKDLVVGIAYSGREGLSKARRDQPDVVFVDIELGDIDGFTVGRTILAEQPSTKVVAITARRDRQALAEAAGSGFHGYLTKDVPLRRFVAVLRNIVGEGAMPPVSHSQPNHDSVGEVRFALRQLSAREREVLEMLREGMTTEAIAQMFGISRNTVRSHVQRILTKLDVHSRLEAVALTNPGRSPLHSERRKSALGHA